MKKLLKPSFWSKLLMGLLIFVQFVIFTVLVLWLIDFTMSTHNGAYALVSIVLLWILDIVFESIAFNSDSPNGFKLTWMFTIFAIPVGGILIYVFFANKSTSKRQRKKLKAFAKPINSSPSTCSAELEKAMPEYAPLAKYIGDYAGSGFHQHTSIKYYPTIEGVFPTILDELKKAKHYIFLEFFIIAEGKMWSSIEEILVEKAKEGVDVRVIYDDLGSTQCVPSRFDACLRKKGIKCYKFNPWRPFIDIRLNNRDHRKIIVIDGHTAFSGGFNLADEYPNFISRFGYWKDNAILLKGEAVENFTYMFLASWVTYITHKGEIDKGYFSSKTFIDEIGGYPESKSFIAPYGDIPFDREAVGESVYLGLIARAKKSVYITTPYLILDEVMQNAIIFAAKQGLDVRLLLPHIPDKKAVFNIARSNYGKLLKAGVKIYEYTPGFVHEKMFVIDGCAGSVGTINLDYRSLYLHMECSTILLNDPEILKMREDFLSALEASHLVTYDEWKRWRKRNFSYWGMLRILSPML